MSRGRTRYVIAYDIRDDKRLRVVAKTMVGFGWRMQYSVFISDLDMMELLDLKTRLARVINHAVDSVAFIDVGSPKDRGQQSFDFMGVAPRMPTSGALIV